MAKCLELIFSVVLLMFVHDWASGDSGALTSCGGSKFKFSWSPRVFKVGATYTFHLSGVANMDFNEGKIHSVVKVPSSTQPIWDNTQPINCDEVPKVLPVKIPCPVKRGNKIDVTQDYTMPSDLSIVPPGDYYVFLDLHNDQGQQFACVNGTMTVAQP